MLDELRHDREDLARKIGRAIAALDAYTDVDERLRLKTQLVYMESYLDMLDRRIIANEPEEVPSP